jgi:hypothetical protein
MNLVSWFGVRRTSDELTGDMQPPMSLLVPDVVDPRSGCLSFIWLQVKAAGLEARPLLESDTF